MARFFLWLKKLLKELFPVWCFFFLAFSLLRLTRYVSLAEYRLRPSDASLVFLGSLIVAKATVLVDKFRFSEKYSKEALIYPTIWKAFIYYLVCFAFQFVDPFFHYARLRHTGEAFVAIERDLVSPRFWVIQLWAVVLLLFYCAVRELIRAVGVQEFKKLFFGDRDRPDLHDRAA